MSHVDKIITLRVLSLVSGIALISASTLFCVVSISSYTTASNASNVFSISCGIVSLLLFIGAIILLKYASPIDAISESTEEAEEA